MNVSLAGQQKELHLIITMGNGPTLLGRNWLEMLHFEWKGVYQLRDAANLAVVYLPLTNPSSRKNLEQLHVQSKTPREFERTTIISSI